MKTLPRYALNLAELRGKTCYRKVFRKELIDK